MLLEYRTKIMSLHDLSWSSGDQVHIRSISTQRVSTEREMLSAEMLWEEVSPSISWKGLTGSQAWFGLGKKNLYMKRNTEKMSAVSRLGAG